MSYFRGPKNPSETALFNGRDPFQAVSHVSLNTLSRDQTYRKKLFPFRISIERGLKHYA
jgi:hypothetical protein